MKTRQPSSRARAFTLIEVLIVIAIMAILAGISFTGMSYVQRKQAESQATVQISLLSKALEEYKRDNGTYPPTGNSNSLFQLLYWNGANATPPGKIYLADLDPNSKKQRWINGAGSTATIVDPWGEEFIYRGSDTAQNPDFDLLSKGQDTLTDSPATEADDIDNF